MSTNLDPKLRLLLRLEGLSMALVGMAGAWISSATLWQVAVVALAPDLSMAGYALGPKIGAWTYNAAHNYVLPLLLIGFGWLNQPSFLPIACIWLVHIGVDRALGYGLKSESGFATTHLGPIGRAS
jgi:hypothetical protein